MLASDSEILANSLFQDGTPGMALEMFRLFEEENLGDRKILAMAGHEDGIICFGGSLDEAGQVLSAVMN